MHKTGCSQETRLVLHISSYHELESTGINIIIIDIIIIIIIVIVIITADLMPDPWLETDLCTYEAACECVCS